MTQNANGTGFAHLKDILETEKRLLLSGHAQDAAALIEEKMRALQEFESIVGAEHLSALSALQRREIATIAQMEMANENAAHFEAIRNGLHSAIARLETLHGSAYVGSYSHNGGKVAFPEATGQYRTKA